MVNRFGVKWTPTLIVLDPDQREHHRFTGYLPPEDFIAQIMLGKGKAEFDLDHFEQAIQCFQEILSGIPKQMLVLRLNTTLESPNIRRVMIQRS